MKLVTGIEIDNKIEVIRLNGKLVIDYLLVFILVAVSGFAFFYVNDEYIAMGFLFSSLVFLLRGMTSKINLNFVLILLVLTLWQFLQNFYFESFALKPIIAATIRFIFAYTVVMSVGPKFVEKFVNLIYFLAIVSLVFYVLFFFPSINNKVMSLAIHGNILSSGNQQYTPIPNLILITFNGYQELRNAGPFWEPGAFAVYLNIALIFNILMKNKIVDKKNILFIIAIITTLSTAGFLALFALLVLTYFLLKPSLTKVFILLPMIGLFTILVINLPFLLPKIKDNIIVAENNNTSRFGSALSDYKLISKNPIIGYGGDLKNMFGTNQWDTRKMHRNNGITAFITQWGIIIFIMYFYNYKKSADQICMYYNTNKHLSYVFLITIILLGFSQGLFKYTFFHSLMFIQFAFLAGDTMDNEETYQDYALETQSEDNFSNERQT